MFAHTDHPIMVECDLLNICKSHIHAGNLMSDLHYMDYMMISFASIPDVHRKRADDYKSRLNPTPCPQVLVFSTLHHARHSCLCQYVRSGRACRPTGRSLLLMVLMMRRTPTCHCSLSLCHRAIL